MKLFAVNIVDYNSGQSINDASAEMFLTKEERDNYLDELEKAQSNGTWVSDGVPVPVDVEYSKDQLVKFDFDARYDFFSFSDCAEDEYGMAWSDALVAVDKQENEHIIHEETCGDWVSTHVHWRHGRKTKLTWADVIAR